MKKFLSLMFSFLLLITSVPISNAETPDQCAERVQQERSAAGGGRGTRTQELVADCYRTPISIPSYNYYTPPAYVPSTTSNSSTEEFGSLFVALHDSQNDDVVVLNEADEIWVLNYGYGCESYIDEDDYMYSILPNKYSDYNSYGAELAVYNSSGTKYYTCDIENAEQITNIGTLTLLESDTNTLMLALDDGDSYLVEYRIGCSRMSSYIDKSIYLYIGGNYLDSLSDEIILPSGDGNCKVLSATNISESLSNSQPTATTSCPSNSSLTVGGDCICDLGYDLNIDSSQCLPVNNQLCQEKYGADALANEGKCVECSEGYQLNEEENNCILMDLEPKIFSDIAAEHRNYNAVAYLKKNGIIAGYSDGTFRPSEPLNRAELLKILVEGIGVNPNPTDYNNCFPDVTDEWYAKYVCYAKSEGFIGGYPDGTFKPANNVNKAEAIKMLLETFLIPVDEVTEAPYGDMQLDQWFTRYIGAAKDLGLLEEMGYRYHPSEFITRTQISENLYRLLTR